MTSQERTAKSERNARRGRTPAFLAGKAWEAKHIKKKRRWNLNDIANQDRRERAAKEDADLDAALDRLGVKKWRKA